MTDHLNELWLLAARLATKRAGWQDAEAWGIAALTRGDSSATTVALASVNARSDEIEQLVANALDFAELKPPSPLQAAIVSITDIATDVTVGNRSPRAAASILSRLYGEFPDLDPELKEYVLWSDEYEELPDRQAEIDADVRAALSSWAQRHSQVWDS